MFATLIYFVVCHAGPADHFATYARELEQKGHEVIIYAAGPAKARCQERGVVARTFEKTELEAIRLANEITDIAVTDVGDPFDIILHRQLQQKPVHQLAYYDNPESQLPGNYNSIAERVMQLAERVLFANCHLAAEPNHYGIGFYPLERAISLLEARKRAAAQTTSKTLVYCGGNNEDYFETAFPHFLRCLESAGLEGWTVLLQQHPGACSDNRDGKLLKQWLKLQKTTVSIKVSSFSTDEALTQADVVGYYQTSMAPLFALAGIPAVQISSDSYRNVLVRNGLSPSVETGAELSEALDYPTVPCPRCVEAVLGMDKQWLNRLELALSF